MDAQYAEDSKSHRGPDKHVIFCQCASSASRRQHLHASMDVRFCEYRSDSRYPGKCLELTSASGNNRQFRQSVECPSDAASGLRRG